MYAPYRPCLPCGRAFFSWRLPLCLLFCDQKSSRKVPLVPRRGARLRGCSPLRTPKRRSRSKKAKPCRSAARFLTLFCSSPSGPSGAKFLYKGGEYFRPRRGQYGEKRKSVKKNAALLRFLAFLLLSHLFRVLRSEQPLRRGRVAIKAPVGLWLARGSQPVGTSTGVAAGKLPPSLLRKSTSLKEGGFWGEKQNSAT